MTKIFETKDIFYNNGLVNLYKFLQKNRSDFDDIELEISSNYLEIKYQDEEIYSKILNKFLKKYEIVHFTKNERIYFDKNLKEFVNYNKVNIKNSSSGNDSKNALVKIKIEELGLSKEELALKKEKYLVKNGYNKKEFRSKDEQSRAENKIVTCYFDKYKKEIYVLSTIEEHIEKFSSYLLDGLKLNSSIHGFENGQALFHDMIKLPKYYSTLDKWDALIYWFGTKIQYYFNPNYFIFLNSSNLEALFYLKKNLKIYDEEINVRDKNEKLTKTNTNIDLYEQLKKDDIFNPNFYICQNKNEFELKFFMYLFSKIFHIEDMYNEAKKNNEMTNKRQRAYDSLQFINFVSYEKDGNLKRSLSEYTKAHKLIAFFKILKEQNLFFYLEKIVLVFSMSQPRKEINIDFERYCNAFLEFKNLRKYYYLTSFKILRNNSMSFGKKLFDFENLYLQKILKGENMEIHQKAKIIGDGIGHFCAEIDSKDLLFKLRNIKNHKQMLSYFADLKFDALKNDGKAKFTKDFNEALSEILDEINENWEIVRDYIAIYAIDKFKTVNFAKNNKN